MWIVGCAIFLLYYLFVFRWYAPQWGASPLGRPMAWSRGWYHIGVLIIAVLLFLSSSYFFYLSSGWMVFVPVVLVPISWVVYAQMQNSRLNDLIRQSMMIQIRMEALGSPQPQINNAIMVQLLGEELSGAGLDFDIHQFMKFCVLSRLGYDYDVGADFQRMIDNPSYVGAGQRTDALIDHWRDKLK